MRKAQIFCEQIFQAAAILNKKLKVFILIFSQL